jgi:hypothetical protein
LWVESTNPGTNGRELARAVTDARRRKLERRRGTNDGDDSVKNDGDDSVKNDGDDSVKNECSISRNRSSRRLKKERRLMFAGGVEDVR